MKAPVGAEFLVPDPALRGQDYRGQDHDLLGIAAAQGLPGESTDGVCTEDKFTLYLTTEKYGVGGCHNSLWGAVSSGPSMWPHTRSLTIPLSDLCGFWTPRSRDHQT